MTKEEIQKELFYKFYIDSSKQENWLHPHPETLWKATLADQDLVLASEDPYYAYTFAKAYQSEADIEKLQNIVANYADWSYWFALNVKGANIPFLQEAVENTYPQWYSFMPNKREFLVGGKVCFFNETYKNLFYKNVLKID